MLKRLLRPSAFKVALLIGVGFAALHGARQLQLIDLHYLELLEAKAIDAKFAFRGPRPLSHQVALVAVDERALQRYGRWPWSRATIAEAVTKLGALGPKVIAFDMALTDPDHSTGLETLARVRQALPPPDPHVEHAMDVLEKLPPAQRSSVQPVFEAALREHQSIAEGQAQLDRALKDTPDAAMSRAVEATAKQDVLGFITMAADEAKEVPLELREAWQREVRASFIPGVYRLNLAKGSAQLIPGSGKRTWRLNHPAAVQAWLPQIAGDDRTFGYFTIKEDRDGTLRRYTPLAQVGENFVPSLAISAVAKAWGSPIQPVASDVALDSALGGVALFDENFKLLVAPANPFDSGRMLIDYAGPQSQWKVAGSGCKGAGCDVVSAADVMDGSADPASLKDKIVFFAVTAIGTFDQRVTPFDSFLPGTFVHMNVAEALVSHHFLESGGGLILTEMGVMLLLALVLGLGLPRLPFAGQLAVLPLGLGGYGAVSQFLFDRGTQIATVTPLLEIAALVFGVIFFQYVTVDAEKRQVRQAFQYYLTESVMTEMLKDPSKLKLGGQKKNLTVLFSDIRGFTTLSEMLEPGEVVRRLNEYLTPMTNLVFQTGGTLDKYMGDAIMAFWGAPVDQPDHALRACETACKMIDELHKLRSAWKAKGEADIDIGIGLNSGDIHVGNMGSDSRFDYTVIGDDVNLASRLEGTNKTYGTRLIIGENTFQQVKGKVVCRELGGVMVKGKKKPVTIYELRRVGTPNEEEQRGISSFERGLTAYRARDWDGAEAAFNEVQKLWANDGPSEKYLEDISEKRAHPPDAGWDGVYVMKTK